jgi:hypothetical protein
MGYNTENLIDLMRGNTDAERLVRAKQVIKLMNLNKYRCKEFNVSDIKQFEDSFLGKDNTNTFASEVVDSKGRTVALKELMLKALPKLADFETNKLWDSYEQQVADLKKECQRYKDLAFSRYEKGFLMYYYRDGSLYQSEQLAKTLAEHLKTDMAARFEKITLQYLELLKENDSLKVYKEKKMQPDHQVETWKVRSLKSEIATLKQALSSKDDELRYMLSEFGMRSEKSKKTEMINEKLRRSLQLANHRNNVLKAEWQKHKTETTKELQQMENDVRSQVILIRAMAQAIDRQRVDQKAYYEKRYTKLINNFAKGNSSSAASEDGDVDDFVKKVKNSFVNKFVNKSVYYFMFVLSCISLFTRGTSVAVKDSYAIVVYTTFNSWTLMKSFISFIALNPLRILKGFDKEIVYLSWRWMRFRTRPKVKPSAISTQRKFGKRDEGISFHAYLKDHRGDVSWLQRIFFWAAFLFGLYIMAQISKFQYMR